MNRVTIFGDFHSNLPALEAVLADMDQRELSPLYCLGDLLGYGTFPNEVIETIGERNIPTLIGNYDQGVGHSSDDCGFAYTSKVAEELGKRSIAWSNEHTTHENKHYLRQLTGQIPLELGELRVQLVHGSPRKINEYLFENRPDASLERLLDMTQADVLVCGHTHIPYRRILPSGRHIVNAGCVGKPKDGNPRFAALGVIGGIAPLFGYAALSLGLVGYVSALFKMSSVFALLWAFIFLREIDVKSRLPGALVIVIGAILIAV